MGIFAAIRGTTSGLSAQRVRMDVISSNVANIETTRTPDGSGPYKRQVVRLSAGSENLPFADLVSRFTGQPSNGTVLTSVEQDTQNPVNRVYDPGHPDAGADGFVETPNVDLITEMTDLTSANRSYQANVTVLNALKQMALRALDIGSR